MLLQRKIRDFFDGMDVDPVCGSAWSVPCRIRVQRGTREDGSAVKIFWVRVESLMGYRSIEVGAAIIVKDN